MQGAESTSSEELEASEEVELETRSAVVAVLVVRAVLEGTFHTVVHRAVLEVRAVRVVVHAAVRAAVRETDRVRSILAVLEVRAVLDS